MKKVPIRRCKTCARFDGHSCHLEDLEPCSYVSRDKSKNTKEIFLSILMFICGVLVTLLILFSCKKENEEPKANHHSAVELLRGDRLSNWEKLIMSIAYTESKFNENAIGQTNDIGVLQITPIYVKEVNRVKGTDFCHEDAFSMKLSLDMFTAMNEAKNPQKDAELAIRLHNKSPEYRRRVMENMKLIEKYEEFREIVKK